MWNVRKTDPSGSQAEQGNSVMSNNSNDGGNGFKGSRIDLSQLGNENWNDTFRSRPAGQGEAPKRASRPPGETEQPVSRDDLFNSRVYAATAARAIKQNRGQSRIWLFASGLFLASIGGIAAAYYLVGPPMALTTYAPEIVENGKLETTSLLAEQNVEDQTISHFRGVTIAAAAPAPPTVDASDPLPDSSEALSRNPLPVDTMPKSETEMHETITPELQTPKPGIATSPADKRTVETDPNIVPAVEPVAEVSSEPGIEDNSTDKIVRIVPTAVTGGVETRTNVNVARTPAKPRKTIGQWLSVPADIELTQPPKVTAAASQQSTGAKPAAGAVKTRQELFKSFQAYLESTGNAETIDLPGQKALFNKFIRWSVEAPVEN